MSSSPKSKYSLEDLAVDNPAVAKPAGSTLSIEPQSLRTNPQDGKTNDSSIPVPLSKHEVGWRRVVRNFSPSW
jgi:hypothetical protein